MKGPDNLFCFFRFILTYLVVFYPFLAVAVDDQPFSQLQNQLKNHASPYLAMHGEDPVKWQEWGADVLEKARQMGGASRAPEIPAHQGSPGYDGRVARGSGPAGRRVRCRALEAPEGEHTRPVDRAAFWNSPTPLGNLGRPSTRRCRQTDATFPLINNFRGVSDRRSFGATKNFRGGRHLCRYAAQTIAVGVS